MAVKTRAELAAEDISIYLPDNATQDIEPVDHRASNVNHADSSLNKLEDNIFPQPTDDSLEYGSDPTAGWDDSATHDLKLAPKKYVDLKTSPKDFTTYYVSKNGDNVTAEAGNDKLPYLTIQGALDAVALLPSSSKVSVKVFGGEFNENVTITGNYYVVLDIAGATINGRLVVNGSVLFFAMLANGSTINHSGATDQTLLLSCDNFLIYGGQYVRSGGVSNTNVISSNSNTGFRKITDCSFVSDSRSGAQDVHNIEFTNCYFEGVGNGVFRSTNCFYYLCEMLSTNATGQGVATNTGGNKFYNCRIEGASGVGVETGVPRGEFHNCSIIGNTASGFKMSLPGLASSSQELLFNGCTITGVVDSINLSGASAAQIQGYVFIKGCNLNAGSGDIIKEPVSYDAGFTGKIIVSNNEINKALNLVVDVTKYKLNNNFNYTI